MKRNALVLAALLAGLIAAGCGKHGDDAVSTVAAGQSQGMEPAAASAGTLPAPADGIEHGAATAAVDSLPPDLSGSGPDSLVEAGAAVEITARGTPDVVAVTLWDGIGRKQPMSFDPERRVWRALYRVPLGTTRESVTLSLTGTNGSGKWRRVWVRVNLFGAGSGTSPEAAPDAKPESHS